MQLPQALRENPENLKTVFPQHRFDFRAPYPVPIAPESFELEEDQAIEQAELAPADAAPSEPVIDMLALEQALDIPDAAFDMSAIEQRYPLLRNAL